MLHNNCEAECPNCGETYYFDFEDGINSEFERDDEIFGVCHNCDCDMTIGINYKPDGEFLYWEVE